MQTQATAQMSLEDIRLSAINQLQKDKFSMILLGIYSTKFTRKETECWMSEESNFLSRRKEGSVWLNCEDLIQDG